MVKPGDLTRSLISQALRLVSAIPATPDGLLEIGKGPIRTGVTALLPRGKNPKPSPVWAGQFSLNGNGEMTGSHWVNDAGYFIGPVCLTNTHSVGMVHHAAVGWMVDTYADHFQEDHGWAMPIVAETYDGCTNDINGRHVTENHALNALNSAASGPVTEGNCGGGTGMLTYEFKGGTGSASRQLKMGEQSFVVAALVQSNFGSRADFVVRGVPVGMEWPEDAPLTELSLPEQGINYRNFRNRLTTVAEPVAAIGEESLDRHRANR